MHKSNNYYCWKEQVKEHQERNLLNSTRSTKINQEQDTSMSTSICTHKQLGINLGFQKSLENVPNCTFKGTCIEHIPRTLENGPWTSAAKAS